MPEDDHDRIIRLEEKLTALDNELEEHKELALQASNVLNEIHTTMISKDDHERLLTRMSNVESSLAGYSGTSSGTMRIFLVAAVMISLMGLIFSIVHALLG